MSERVSRPGLLRPRSQPGAARVTAIELFFDLVFAFAITQLSHALLKDPSPLGALHTLLLFLAVWWVWVYTTWVTNWLDPDAGPVRLALLALMLAGLILSAALPDAFTGMGLVFACAFAGMQVGRSLFMIAALGDRSPGNRRNFQRITVWLGASAVLWIVGGFAEGLPRLLAWVAALGIEYAGPAFGFRTLGLGRSTTTDWDVDGGHLAERCSNFILVALGESVLVTGASFGERAWTTPTVAAMLAAFTGSVAMWWIYFDTGMARVGHRIEASGDPGRIARLAYTYGHLPIAAGIVVCAVADEIALAHPGGAITAMDATIILGGPALYLVGNILFKLAAQDRRPYSHGVGLALLAGLTPFAASAEPLALAAATSTALVAVAGLESFALRRP
jgi:low temperature requirement protein LtrA